MKKAIILLLISAVALLGGCNVSTEEKTQQVEIWSLQDDTIVRVIDDQDEIINFTNNIYDNTENWSDLEYTLSNAKPLYCFVYWQEPTRTLFGSHKDMVITSQETLYKDTNGNYYLNTEIDEDILPSTLYDFLDDIDANSMTEQIPAETARYLIKIAEGAEIHGE